MSWTVDDARELYNIAQWGEGYFDISDAGDLIARPDASRPEHTVNFNQVARDMAARGMSLPLLVRFNNILHDRVDQLCGAFEEARTAFDYQGEYRAVYPIKVNQQHDVVEQLLQHGGAERFGLEAGSKPELMAVLAVANPGAVIVCNGYKDREYIRLALIAEQLGHSVFIVVEKPGELDLVLAESSRMKVAPRIGVRVRLASTGRGKWQDSGGEKSKFGLSASQILVMVERLRRTGRLSILQLVHYHLGSQLANIRDIQRALRECARYFVELHKLGANIQWVDVGGGLGVDYEGSKSRSSCSTNYSMQQYAAKVVGAMAETCAEHNLPQPNIISESGRALTAHHAVLLVDIIDVDAEPGHDLPPPVKDDDPLVLRELWRAQANISRRTALETYHEALYYSEEAHNLYVSGQLSLKQWAHAEKLYTYCCSQVRNVLGANPGVHQDVLAELDEKLAAKVFCNFSLFQSLPDSWAIDQLFPVLPLRALNREPTRRIIIQDVTCDSDGKIDKFVAGEGVSATLPVPVVAEKQVLGLFLVGAYQEILGDMHNLFGDTHSVHVQLDAQGDVEYRNPLAGDTVSDMLHYVDYDTEALVEKYRKKLAASGLPDAQQEAYLDELVSGLSGYCYLED